MLVIGPFLQNHLSNESLHKEIQSIKPLSYLVPFIQSVTASIANIYYTGLHIYCYIISKVLLSFSMAEHEEWNIISFKKFLSDKRKITCKKHSLETDIYPSDGHRSFLVQYNNYSLLYCIGGSRHEAESLSKDILIYKFATSKDSDDMWLDETIILKGDMMKGAKFHPVTYPAVTGWLEDGLTTMVVHGGLVISSFRPTSDTYIIQHKVGSKSASASVHLSSKPEGALLSRSKLMDGSPPDHRYGHVLVKLMPSEMIMFGGSRFNGRTSRSGVRIRGEFRSSQTDNQIYHLKMQGM